jgi:hypothetical protein
MHGNDSVETVCARLRERGLDPDQPIGSDNPRAPSTVAATEKAGQSPTPR